MLQVEDSVVQIEVSFDRWKSLTALLRDEDDSYDAVIDRLIRERDGVAQVDSVGDGNVGNLLLDGGTGAWFKDVFLPDGTELRATHKGKTYFAKISGSEWVDLETGESRTSPSKAAYFITGNSVNGWLFWLVRRPKDREWNSLSALRAGARADG